MKIIRKLIPLAILLSILVCAWLIWSNSVFRLVSTTPSLKKEVPTSTTSIVLKFNKELDASKITSDSITINPNIKKGYSVSKDTITINLTKLNEKTKYNLTISKLVALNGKSIQDLQFDFKGIYVPFGDLSGSEQNQQINTVDPHGITTVLPYETDNYYIDYVDCVQKNPCISIEMKFNVPESYYKDPRYLADVSKYRKEAVKYLEENNIETTNYTLSYSEPVLLNQYPKGIYISSSDYTGDGAPPEEQ